MLHGLVNKNIWFEKCGEMQPMMWGEAISRAWTTSFCSFLASMVTRSTFDEVGDHQGKMFFRTPTLICIRAHSFRVLLCPFSTPFNSELLDGFPSSDLNASSHYSDLVYLLAGGWIHFLWFYPSYIEKWHALFTLWFVGGGNNCL